MILKAFFLIVFLVFDDNQKYGMTEKRTFWRAEKRQRENTKVRKISKNPHSKRGFFISCLAEKLYLLNIEARLQVVHNKLNILCNFCNCTQVSITVNLHNTQFMMHFFNGFFTVNSWI